MNTIFLIKMHVPNEWGITEDIGYMTDKEAAETEATRLSKIQYDEDLASLEEQRLKCPNVRTYLMRSFEETEWRDYFVEEVKLYEPNK